VADTTIGHTSLPPGGRDDPSSHFLSLPCPPFPVEAAPLNPAMGEHCRPPCGPGRQTRILCTLSKNAGDCNNSSNTYKLNYSYSDWRHFSRVKNFCIPVGDAFPHLSYGPQEMRGMHPHRRTARVWIRLWPVVLCRFRHSFTTPSIQFADNSYRIDNTRSGH